MNPSADPSAVLSTRSHGGREGERVLSLPWAFPLQGRGQQPHEPDTHSHTGLRRLPVLAGLQPYARTEAQGRPGGTLASFTSQLCGATGSGSRIRCPLCLSRIPPSVRSRPIPRVHRIRGLRRVTSHWLSCPPRSPAPPDVWFLHSVYFIFIYFLFLPIFFARLSPGEACTAREYWTPPLPSPPAAPGACCAPPRPPWPALSPWRPPGGAQPWHPAARTPCPPPVARSCRAGPPCPCAVPAPRTLRAGSVLVSAPAALAAGGVLSPDAARRGGTSLEEAQRAQPRGRCAAGRGKSFMALQASIHWRVTVAVKTPRAEEGFRAPATRTESSSEESRTS